MPKGTGGLTPALGLSYSSGSAADFAKGSGMKGNAAGRFFSQAGQFGFGWNLTGIGEISKVRDSQDNNIVTNLLTLGGASYKLISNGDGTWETSPKSNLKIHHSGCTNEQVAEGTGTWEIVDTSGTWYVFGADVGSDCTLSRAANQHLSTAWRFKTHPKNGYSNLEMYRSMLRLVRDIHGNEIHYTYRQEHKNIEGCMEDNKYPTNLIDGSSTNNNGFYQITKAVYLDTITYGSNNQFQVKINYEDRDDYKLEYGGKDGIPAYQYACNQNYFARQRTDQIVITNQGHQYALYDLSYNYNDKHFSNGDGDGNMNIGHLILTSIKRFGTDLSTSLPVTSYSYSSSVANEILLSAADNGSGGKVTYHYDKKPYQRCKIDNATACYSDVNHDQRWAVISRDVEDSVTGKKFTVSYDYSGGLSMFLTEDEDSFDGYEFLGYAKALQKTSKNNSSDIAAVSRSTFFQANRNGSCINPSAKKGKPSLTETLGVDGTLTAGSVLSQTQTNYRAIPFAEPACQSVKLDYLGQKLPEIYPSDVTSTVEGVTTKVAYEYDQYGNTTLVTNQGFSGGGDDRYSVTRYAVDKSGRNLIGKAYLSIASKDRAGKRVLSLTKTYYDNSAVLGEIPAEGKGDATKTESGILRTQRNSEALDDVDTEAEVLGASFEPELNVLGISIPETRTGNQYIYLPSSSGTPTPPVPSTTPTRAPSLTPTKVPTLTPTKVPTTTPTIPTATATLTPTVQPTSIPFPQSVTFVTTLMKYDPWGNVYETIDASGGKTTITFDDATHTLPVKVTQPKITGQGRWETTTTYDSILGKPETITDINGVQTNIRYDTLGRVKKIWGPNESRNVPAVKADYGDEKPMWVKTEILTQKAGSKYIASYAFYNGLGQKIEEQTEWEDNNNNKRKISYTSFTSLGQSEYSILPIVDKGNLGAFVYDDRVKNPANDKKTSSHYDNLGRVVKVKNPDGTQVNTDYQGLVTTMYDANDPQKTGHNKKVTTADAFGQTVKIEEFKDGGSYLTQTFVYDKAGRLKIATDPGGHQSVYKYNILGQKTQEINNDSGKTQYAYDETGSLIAKKDNKGQVITMNYDKINRIKRRTYPDGSSVSYTYDEGSGQKGKLTSVSYNGNITKYTYDNEGKVTQEDKTITGDATTYSTNYTYDDAKRLAKITYPADASGNREVVTQTYITTSLPNTLSSTLGNLITSSIYNTQGQLTDRAFANNTSLSQTYYNANFRLKSITLNSATADIPQQGTVAGAETVKNEPEQPVKIERKKISPPYLFPLSDILSFVKFLRNTFQELTK